MLLFWTSYSSNNPKNVFHKNIKGKLLSFTIFESIQPISGSGVQQAQWYYAAPENSPQL